MKALISAFVLMIGIYFVSCSSSSDSGSESSSQSSDDEQENDEENNSETTQTGTLAVGEVEVNVAMVSADASFASTNTDRNQTGTAGTLAVGTSLTQNETNSENLQLLESYPASKPEFPTGLITSGPPSGFKLTITKITAAYDGKIGKFEGKVKLDTVHINQLDEIDGVSSSTKTAIAALKGVEYNTPDLLKAAMTDAGLTNDQYEAWIYGFDRNGLKVVDESKSVNKTIFEDNDGVEISADSGEINLSALLSKLDQSDSDAAPKMEIPVGEYNMLKVSFKHGAKIKGCVDANWDGSNKNSLSGTKKYCTRSGKSIFDSSKGDNSYYEDYDPAEFVDINIKYSSNESKTTNDTFEKEFPIPSGFEIKKGETTSLTMVIDLNAMLRYYNDGSSDPSQTVNPGWPEGAYFFDSMFNSSVYFFLGKAGRIYGYELGALSCPKSKYTVATKACSDNFQKIPVWLTLIMANDGTPLSAVFNGKDDRDYTVLQGGTFNEDNWVVQNENDSNKVNIKYSQRPTFGELKGFPKDLESTAVGSDIDGVTFEVYNPNQDEAENIGPVYVTRKL